MLVGFRGAVASLIFSKTLKQHANVQDKDASLTHMSSDIDQLAFSLDALCQVWAQVIELVIGLYLLSKSLGWVCVAPIVIVVSKLPSAAHILHVNAYRVSLNSVCWPSHQVDWSETKRLDCCCADSRRDDIFYARLDEKCQDDGII